MALLFDNDDHAFTLSAVYWDGAIDLRQFRLRHPHYPVLSSDPLVLEVVRGQYAVLTKFGSVVFWNADAAHVEDICNAVDALPGVSERSEKAKDTLRVKVGQTGSTAQSVNYGEVSVPELTLDKLRILSLAMAQSVALEHVELEVHRAIEELQPRIDALRSTGRLVGSEKAVLRDVGFVLTVRSQVLANMTLFDKPPEAWESEAIDRLDSLLWDHFDLEERMAAVNQKVQFLNDLNGTFLEILNHRKSVRLEQIVVLLILFEIVMGLYELWQKLH